MLMVGGKDPDYVWCIKQLNQDLSDIFMELTTEGPRMDRQHSIAGASDHLHLNACEITFPPPYHLLIRI